MMRGDPLPLDPVRVERSRRKFIRWCNSHGIEIVYGGADWNDAFNRKAFLCGIIRDAVDFYRCKPLMNGFRAYMATAVGWHAPRWLHLANFSDQTLLLGDAKSSLAEIDARYKDYLRDDAPGVAYFSAASLARRNTLRLACPIRVEESESDYSVRLSKIANASVPPEYVHSAGYWHLPTEQALCLDAVKTERWSFDAVPGGSWTRYVTVVCSDLPWE